MAITRLKFQGVRRVERSGLLMLVQFTDDAKEMYEWAPAWKDVEQIFLRGIDVERFNKPESQFLNQFARTAQQVAENAQRVRNARKIAATFRAYSDGQLLLQGSNRAGDSSVTPAFDVTIDFLDRWLGRYVEVLVVNDQAVLLRAQDVNFVEEYPPRQDEPDDLPF